MNRLQPLLWAILIGISACSSVKQETVTFLVAKKEFSDIIRGTGTIESANSFTIVAPSLSSGNIKIGYLAPEGSTIQEGDTVCILTAPDIQKYYDQYDEELEKGKADLARQKADNSMQISLLDAQLREIETRRSLTSLDSLQMKFSPPIRQKIQRLELQKSNIQEQKILKKINAQKKINEQSLRALTSQVMQKEQLAQRFQDQMDQCTLTAPKAGMMVYPLSPQYMIMYSTGETEEGGGKIGVGSSVRRRMSLVQLPDLDSMQVILMVQEADYKRIDKGQKVRIIPQAIPDFETTGTVITKSLASQRLAYQSQVKTYKITIDIDCLDHQLQPGLSANCEIIVQKIPDQLVIPSISIIDKDSAKWVYVQKEKYFHCIPIQTGKSSRSETIILEGLHEDETIALLEPPYELIKQTCNDQNE